MSDSNYTKLYGNSAVITQQLVQLLHENNIETIIKDEGESARLAGFGSSINNFQEVHVHKDSYEKALAILTNFEQSIK